ncbi:MAG: EAL domain-containing protein [Spirochaetales bacterium]|nr:EAL domain-containing protein [Spirochaetales bacterium]
MSFFIVGIVCSGLMIPGIVSYGLLYGMDRNRENRAIFHFNMAMALTVFIRTLNAGFALFRPDAQMAYRWSLGYEVSLLLFFPLVPEFISVILTPMGPREQKIHRTFQRAGFVLSLGFTAVILVAPWLYIIPYTAENLPHPVLLGRGEWGILGLMAMSGLLIYVFYALFSALEARVRRRGRPHITTLSVGLILCIIALLPEFYEVFTGRYPGPIPHYAYSRLMTALTVLSLTSIAAMSQKSAGETKELEYDRRELQISRDKLEKIAFIDEMTGLPNRQALFRNLPDSCRPGHTLVLASIDNLPFVNSYHGYHAGDGLIREIGSICRRESPPGTTVHRMNAGTFGLLVPGTLAEAESLADRLLRDTQHVMIAETEEARPTLSVGVSEAENNVDWETWAKRANTALERARIHHNRRITFDPTLHEDEKRRHGIVAAMKRSLETQGFHIVYQPIVDHQGLLEGAEALLRWEHPEWGPVGPSEFIPLAEASGLITRLTHFVIRRVSEDFCHGMGRCEDWQVGINLSGKDLTDNALPAMVDHIMRNSSLNPERLAFEVTETDLIADWHQTSKNMQALRERGYCLSLDDFGTGYSSLSYLDKLEMDKLKIDRSFITEIPGDKRREALLEAVIHLGHDLGLTVVVEGVESIRQFNHLRRKHCDLFQGYYFSRPLSLSQFNLWSEEHS